MNPYSIAPLMSGCLILLLGIYTFSIRSSSEIKKIFLAFSGAVFIWLISFSLMYNTTNADLALTLARCGYLGLCFGGVLVLHFHAVLLNMKIKSLKVLYAISAIFVPLSWTPYFFKGVKQFFWGYYPQGSLVLYPLFVIFFLGTLWAGPILAIRVLLRKKSEVAITDFQRKQIKLSLVGFLICNLAVVDYFAKFGVGIYPAGYINVVLWFVILSFTILQYHLMDEEKIAEIFQREKLAAVGTMAASLNHELRNPLFIAKGKAETYFDQMDRGLSPVDAKSRLVVESMYAQLVRASDIMQRFSDFAKPFYNEVKKENVVIAEAFNNVLRLVSSEFALSKIRVSQTLTNGLSLKVNPRHFEEILFNLTLNACHAMEKQGGELTLHAYQPNGKVIVEISDSGPGISKDLQKRIFDPFYTTKGSNGTGLGLYITKQLVERNGGKIRVESTLGAGSLFRLEF